MAGATWACQPEHRFNRGFFITHGSSVGIDVEGFVDRLLALLQAPSAPQHLQRLLRGNAAPPLRLLDGALPHLRPALLRHCLSAAAHARPLPPPPLLASAFDGLHLTTLGLASALIAWSEGHLHVTCPVGHPVVQSPVAVLHTSLAGGGVSAPRGSGHLGHSATGPSEGIGQHRIDLAFLLDRWPHLPRVFESVTRHDLDAISAWVHAVSAGAKPLLPGPLLELLHHHNGAETTPMLFFSIAHNATVIQSKMYNQAAVDLLGASVQQPQTVSGVDRWLHPQSLVRRCLAQFAAAAARLDAFQFEGLFLRMLPAQSVAAAASAGPAAITYVPFFAVETSFVERFKDGTPFAKVMFLSDVVMSKQPVSEKSLDFAGAQMDAIAQLLLGGGSGQHAEMQALPMEVGMLCRSTGLPPAAALALLPPDLDSVRVRIRLNLLLLGGRAGHSEPEQQSAEVDGHIARAAHLGALLHSSVDAARVASEMAKLHTLVTGGGSCPSILMCIAGRKFTLPMPTLGGAALLAMVRQAEASHASGTPPDWPTLVGGAITIAGTAADYARAQPVDQPPS